MKAFGVGVLIVLVLTGSIYAAFWRTNQKGEFSPYSKSTRIEFHPGFPLPTATNDLFVGSGVCEECHGEGILGPNPDANTDPDGNDISPVSLWQSTMMANAAKDPFWRAKVSHEKMELPSLGTAIEETCMKCHAPLGKYHADHYGLPYTLSDMEADPIGMDGASCLACHALEDAGLGNSFSGEMVYNTDNMVYGQYSDPLTGPMTMQIGFTPTHGAHISQSEACGVCHTLITHPVDEFGTDLDTFFVEQAIYHEWLNSDYKTEETTCQECHMPVVDYDVTLSNKPPWLGSRTDFAKHDLVGANVFMLRLFMENVDTLNLTASTDDFELSMLKAENMLQNESVSTLLYATEVGDDSVQFNLELENLAGHKLPAGYPSRRLIVEFFVENSEGDTIFHSGKFDSQYGLTDESLPFEPHHDLILSDSDVQVYEMVMADNNGDVTTVLERAFDNLKDNRLTPKGFSSSHSAYDTVKIVGSANMDPDFDMGAGSDIVHYRLKKEIDWESWTVTSRVYYQTLPPKWTEEMFSYSTPEIDLFKDLYYASNLEPVLMAEDKIIGSSGIWNSGIDLIIWPNPSTTDIQLSSSRELESVSIFSEDGKLVFQRAVNGTAITLNHPPAKGTYIVRIDFEGGKSVSKKIIFH